METVEPRHHEVETEKDELVASGIFFISKEMARQEAVLKLGCVLKKFHNQKDAGASDGCYEIADQFLPLVGARLMNGHHHSEATHQQHYGIQRAERFTQVLMGEKKGLRKSRLHQRESGE